MLKMQYNKNDLLRQIDKYKMVFHHRDKTDHGKFHLAAKLNILEDPWIINDEDQSMMMKMEIFIFIDEESMTKMNHLHLQYSIVERLDSGNAK